jgi:hypothetical protein
VFKLSDLMSENAAAQVPLVAPPGAWLDELSDGFCAGASTRSPTALFLIPFMLVWSGGSLGGIYGSQLLHGHFSAEQSLFGIPFLIGTLVFGSIAIMTVAGKCELTVHGDAAELFVGVGRLGWRRRFHWSEINTVGEVREAPVYGRWPGSQGVALVLEGSRRFKFGSGINEARRYFLLQTLRRKIKHARPVEPVPFR